MQELRTAITKDILKQPNHDKTYDALVEAENHLVEELTKAGGNKETIGKLIEATYNYDKFIFKVYLNKVIQLL